LGALVSNDWMIYLADGTINSMTDAEFQEKYDVAGDTATLTGDDWE